MRKQAAQHRSKISSIIIGSFFFLLTIVFLLLVVLLLFKPRLEHKNIVFVPKNIGGGEGKIFFAEIFPEKNELNVFEIDGGEEAEVIGGFGKYKLESVLQLLKLEKKDSLFIRAAFSSFLQKGIDEVIEYESVERVNTKLSLFKLFLQNSRTLSFIFLIKDLKNEQLSFSKIENLDNWRSQSNLGSSTKIDEACTVAIVNTTVQTGLAGELSKILENSGVEVVRVTNNLWGGTQTQLYVDEAEACLPVKQRVRSISPIDLKEAVDINITSQYRANLVLFIGDDMALLFAD